MSRLQSSAEERANMLTHAGALVISLVGWVILAAQGFQQINSIYLIGMTIFCLALVLQYLVSALYHGAKPGPRKDHLHVWDHALIYVLIAGSYSPFCLVALEGTLGRNLLISLWACALLGILFKIRWTGRFRFLSTCLYLLMGWAALFVYEPLSQRLSGLGMAALIGGGILYSIGAVFYLIEKIRFHHAIWHVFVLGGSISHLVAVATLR